MTNCYFFLKDSKFKMRWSVLLLFLVKCECFVNYTRDCANVKTFTGFERKRRHLTFPANSNVVLTISLVKAFMTHAPSGWNIALEIDVMFPLPEEKFTSRFFRRKLHHRQKRELWERLQSALEFHNLNGRSCIFRSICEARTHLAPPGRSLIHDVLRIVFLAPVHEPDFREEMKSYNELNDPTLCDQKHDCPISLIDFVTSVNKQ